jgi:SAM-dependent methyltransferase
VPDRNESTLYADVSAMCADARCLRAVLAQAQDLPVQAPFEARIHPRDQMLLHSLREHRDAGAAFSQYFAIALQQYAAASEVMRAVFGDARDLRVLDFACGYGRLLRFLGLALPRGQLWASELQEDALAFVADVFGVPTIASHADPARFDPPQRFDVIWVASLFSHLPDALFDAWMRRLYGLLTPRGVICFSVRDVALLPPGVAVPASGLVYSGASENADLGADIYGTTYADEARVRRAVRAAAGGERPLRRLRRALANEQDLYVAAADPARDLSALAGFRRGAWGWLDRRELRDGRLELEGWAASLDDGAVAAVEVEVDGRVHACATGIERPDVAAAFGDARLDRAGWRFETTLDAGATEAFVVASTRSLAGERALLYVGTVRAA